MQDSMLMSAGSHHPPISTLRAAAGSTMMASAAGDAAAGSASTAARAAMERSGSGQEGLSLRCPRCDSSNTKFCYYNNYSLSQPRHFCKDCKRYWTRGGALRNVPVGGGCRKNKRTRKHINSSRATASSPTDIAPMPPLSISHPSPTPIATAAATASSSNLGTLLYGDASDVSQLAFPNPCVPYDLLSLGVFPSNADEDCLPELKTQLADHRILQQTAPPSSATASCASLLQDYSLFGSNPMASLHASTLKQQRQQQQGMTQNPNLSQYITLLSHATCENPLLQNDVQAEGNREESTTGLINQHRFSWHNIPSRENSLLESVANEYSSLYWNAAAASAFGGGALL